jgi:hypothetical protein
MLTHPENARDDRGSTGPSAVIRARAGAVRCGKTVENFWVKNVSNGLTETAF